MELNESLWERRAKEHSRERHVERKEYGYTVDISCPDCYPIERNVGVPFGRFLRNIKEIKTIELENYNGKTVESFYKIRDIVNKEIGDKIGVYADRKEQLREEFPMEEHKGEFKEILKTMRIKSMKPEKKLIEMIYYV